MQILEVSDMVPERRLTNPFRTDFSFRASSHSYSGNFERNRGLHGRKQRWHKHQRMASDGNKEDQGTLSKSLIFPTLWTLLCATPFQSILTVSSFSCDLQSFKSFLPTLLCTSSFDICRRLDFYSDKISLPKLWLLFNEIHWLNLLARRKERVWAGG